MAALYRLLQPAF